MKIWHISDTHGSHKSLVIPEGIDVVIHSGDCSNYRDPYNNESEVRDFIDWFSGVDIPTKIYVAGNHDTSIEKGLIMGNDFTDNGITYLENESIVLDGIKIFGSPHTPQFGQWAFMKARHKLERVWGMAIDDDVDVIVTHGPPKGILDLAEDRNGCLEYCGDKSLLNRVKEVNPKLVLFGHIHNARDIVNTGIRKLYGLETIFSNATTVTDGKRGELTSNGNVIEI